MKIQVILIDEQNGKWGWSVRGKGFSSGGDNTADTKDEAEQQAKEFVRVLIKKETVNLATDTLSLREGKRIG
jgi:hypothetical protein